MAPDDPDSAGAPAVSRALPLAMLLLLGTLWGASFSIAKVGVEGGVPPLGFALWNSLGAALVLLAICRLRRLRLALSGRHLAYYLIAGQLGVSIPNILFYHVIDHIPAGLMALVVTTAPLLTYVFALALTMEAFSLRRALGLGLGFAGAIVMVAPRASLPEAAMTGWVLLGFLTPAFYATNSVFSARARPPDSASLGLACGMLLGAATVQLPIVLLAGDLYLPLPPFEWRDAAVAGQVAISSVAYVLFFELLRLAGPVYFSQVGYVVTLTGLVWGMIFFGERHSGWIYLATALIFTGLALVNLKRRSRA